MSTPQGLGLATWRRRQAEDKALQVAELDRLREVATVEIRDGRAYRVIRIPDLYGWGSLEVRRQHE